MITSSFQIEASDIYSVKVYFGLSKPEGGSVSLSEWNSFEQEIIAKHFEGFNLIDSIGYYKGQPEKSKILTVIMTKSDFYKIEQIANNYIATFSQNSVMVTKDKLDDWLFYSGKKTNKKKLP